MGVQGVEGAIQQRWIAFTLGSLSLVFGRHFEPREMAAGVEPRNVSFDPSPVPPDPDLNAALGGIRKCTQLRPVGDLDAVGLVGVGGPDAASDQALPAVVLGKQDLELMVGCSVAQHDPEFGGLVARQRQRSQEEDLTQFKGPLKADAPGQLNDQLDEGHAGQHMGVRHPMLGEQPGSSDIEPKPEDGLVLAGHDLLGGR